MAGKGRVRYPDPLGEGFWARVQTTGLPKACWEWTGARLVSGYGVIQLPGIPSKFLAHRISMALFLDLKLAALNGLEVCHECDNPRCVRPDHLFIGTHADNMRDGASKRRWPHGTRHHNSKLTEDQVRQIRRRVAAGESQATMCREFGLTSNAVHAVIHRRTWTHVLEAGDNA